MFKLVFFNNYVVIELVSGIFGFTCMFTQIRYLNNAQ